MSASLEPNDDQKEVMQSDNHEESHESIMDSHLQQFQSILNFIPKKVSQTAVHCSDHLSAVVDHFENYKDHLKSDVNHFENMVKQILSKITSFASKFFEELRHEVWMAVLSFITVMMDPNAEKLLKLECVAALLYLITPVDAIPDTLPGIGLFDDSMLILKVQKDLGERLNDYREDVQAKLGGKTKEVVMDKGKGVLNDILGDAHEEEAEEEKDVLDDIRRWKQYNHEVIESQRLAMIEAKKIWEKELDEYQKLQKINTQFEDLTEEVVSLRKKLQLKEKEIAELKRKSAVNSRQKNDEYICSNRMATCTVL